MFHAKKNSKNLTPNLVCTLLGDCTSQHGLSFKARGWILLHKANLKTLVCISLGDRTMASVSKLGVWNFACSPYTRGRLVISHINLASLASPAVYRTEDASFCYFEFWSSKSHIRKHFPRFGLKSKLAQRPRFRGTGDLRSDLRGRPRPKKA